MAESVLLFIRLSLPRIHHPSGGMFTDLHSVSLLPALRRG